MNQNLPPERNKEIFDVVVVGGGVNGTAALRELAGAGYKVLLVEAEDLGSGASGRSSRMLHCGLRYLEGPDPIRNAIRHPIRFARALHMARDAMQARAELAQDETVGTRAIELSFPIWRDGPFPRWQLDAGLRLLRLIGPSGVPLDVKSRDADAAGTHPIGRHLRDQDALRGMVSFREYLFTEPERLCIDNALDAELHGAELRLMTRAELRGRDVAGLWRLGLEGPGSITEARALVVLNLAGSWADGLADFGKRLVRGTKGAHIIVRLPEGFADRGIATMHRGGHPFYGLPLGQDRFYFGPTETPFEGDARNVHADRDDLAFLLGEANHLLPGLGLTEKHVEQCWAGVRPLTEDASRPMGARERRVHDLAPQGFENVLAMTAGPVMSLRSAGRRMLSEVVARIGPPKARATISLGQTTQAPTDAEALAVTHEHAPDLYAVLARRTGAVWSGMVSREDAARTADTLAPLFGWSAVRKASEIEAFLARQETEFCVPRHNRKEPDQPAMQP
ncbi:glycerol-3-phosphate dehydrogenase [Sulfitobacter sp. EhC04]|uniref:FAD-dependent oxidoreductase n=1 Tax=Sulfitobacter sp. EhC04 TaxID=1849168 RepID=UPI0007F329F1|nr:FAD-dependent oxidoreductase [Sulfitobacter sp. EhC04]OAN70961.1 glycerol-3-phosphate dehydrogenase [Sulfitobacter sp. EhC04]